MAAGIGGCIAIGSLLGSANVASQQAPRFGGTPSGLYAAACAGCHGADGRGRSIDELGFDLPVPDLTDCSFATREPDLDWTAVIHDGGPARGFDRKMPAFGDALTDDEIRDVLGHVRTLCVDANWPRGDLNFPKPLFTEKAYPEDEAIVRTTVNTQGDSAFEQRFTFEKRFGSRSQIEISLPWMRNDLGPPDDDEGGIGDLALAFKHAVYHNLEDGSILSLGGELVLPSGDEDRGFGKGTTVIEPFILFGKLLPRDTFVHFQAKLELPVESGFDDELVLRTALGRTWTTGGPFGRSWTPIIEALGAKALVSEASTEWDLVPQLQVTLNTRQHIMANFGLRVPVTDSSTRDTQFVFYVLWDWFDGGLTEGW
jgi:mono/diheme cytochrome c family protein